MRKDQHYYMAYHIFRSCGFPPAQAKTVAWACQYVDDCNPSNVEPFQVGQRMIFPTVTADYSFWASPTVQEQVYMPFHFIPGMKKDWLMKVVANGMIVRRIFLDSLRDRNGLFPRDAGYEWPENLYRVGIALHAYQDSFSHQGFSGFQDDRNSCYPWYHPVSAVPNVGHAEMRNTPDETDTQWSDPRNDARIDNGKRFCECSQLIAFMVSGRSITIPSGTGASFARRVRAIKTTYYGESFGYDADEWFDAAKKSSPQGYAHTDFAKFQRAAREHRQAVFAELLERKVVIE